MMWTVNDGGEIPDEPITADTGRPILENDSALVDVARRFDLRIH